jgi:DNA-directed RNA polymerase specialized sigma24 family protein
VETRVRRTLNRRGAPAATIDDALQTAALQALSRGQTFDDTEGLVRWVTVVAWHEVALEWRRQARVDGGPVPDLPDRIDPAVVVENRMTLDAVAEGLAALSSTERVAIATGAASLPGNPEPARLKMRRYRARRRLAGMSGWTIPEQRQAG